MEIALRDIYQKEIITNKTISRIIGVSSFILFTALGAMVKVRLPFTPVPLTLQTFFVLLAGAILGKRLGAISQLGYLALGISGASVFSQGAGLTYVFGATGGYILGFIAASFLVGSLIGLNKKFPFIIFIMALGSLVILLSGATWLGVIFNLNLKNAFLLGVAPFIAGDTLKTLLAGYIYWKFQARTREIFG